MKARRTKETPEQIAARQAEENRRIEAVRARKAAQKLEAENALKARIVQNLETAQALNNSNDYVRTDIGRTWMKIQKALEEKTLELLAHPANTLGWANIHELAAEREILDGLVYALNKPDRIYDATEIQAVLNELIGSLTRSLLDNRFAPNCSSITHNAMNAIRADVAVRMLRQLEIWKARVLDMQASTISHPEL